MKKEEKSGRTLLTIWIDYNLFNNKNLFFIVFTKESEIVPGLGYFSFKYSLKEKDEFFEFSDKEIHLNYNDNNYNISFEPLPLEEISYYIKAIYKEKLIEEEKIDTIALSESEGKYLLINNYIYEENKNKSISCQLTIDKEISYIKVMAVHNSANQKLFYLYKPVKIEDSGKVYIYVIIGIACFLVLIALALIIFVWLYKKKNENLIHKVKRISFVRSKVDEKSEDEENLLFDDRSGEF